MAGNEASTDTAALSPNPLRWRILGFVGVAQLMLIVDVTVVAIALPNIETDLDVSRQVLTWTVSAYALTFGGLMLLGGRIADLIGAKKVLLTGLLVFTAASLVAGLADSPGMLIGGRIAQGVGAALLSPSALSVVVTLFDGDERNKALGIWSALGGGGAALGVLIGGVLTEGPGWPWVFYINVPIGLVIVAALSRLLPQTAGWASGRVDVLGALLVTASTATLIFAFINAGDSGWLTGETGLLVLLAAVGYLAFVTWQRRARSPLMDVRLLARRPVATGTFLVWIATALMIAVFFLGTFYFQQGREYGALETGLLFLPVALATILAANLTGRTLGRFGAQRLAVAGLLIAVVGMGIPVISLEPVAVTIGVSIAGAGAGVLFVVASATALGQVAQHEAGVASGIVSTFHEFGAASGAAVVSSVAATSLVGGTLDGFENGFTLAAVAAGVAALVAAGVTPRKQAA